MVVGPVLPNQPPAPTLIDLATGQKTQIPPPVPGVNFVVASDGTVLVNQSTSGAAGIGLWKQGQFTPLTLPAGVPFRPEALSDDAQTFLYTDVDPSGRLPRLVARNLSTATDTGLFSAPASTALPTFLSVSRNGRYVLLQLGGTAYVADATTGKSQAIPLPDGELVLDGTLSGSGNMAFLATSTGRIVSAPLAAGMPGPINPLVPVTAYVNILQPFSPGEYVALRGSLPGSVGNWQGRILLDNRPVFVLAAKPGEVDVQIPWDQPAGTAQFHLDVPSDSPFEQNQPVFVPPVSPTFLPLPAGQSSILGQVAIIRGDFSGLLTTQPKPGDIVHVYMTGLGQVQGAPVTGQPAPLDQLFPIAGSLTCTFPPQTTNADTLFAGLAPGLIGIYQLSFRIPEDPNQSPITGMSCKLQQPNATATFGVSGTVAAQP